ncbi:MAG: Bor family protein [Alphaproteobacteria bacterium]|nr:Bor family protein [Alphaproteobacteria bacterium]
MKKLLICIGLALTLSACGSDHIIRFNLDQQPDVKTAPSYKGRSHFFFWGMFQKKDYNLVNVCHPNGISAVETNWTFYDSLMGGLTMGIYAPESYAVYCN